MLSKADDSLANTPRALMAKLTNVMMIRVKMMMTMMRMKMMR